MKTFFRKSNLKVVVLLILLVLTISFGAAYAVAIGVYSEGYMSTSGAGAQNINIDAAGTCKTVTNTSGKNVFIPTKSATEWTNFSSHLPSGVTLADCVVVPPTYTWHAYSGATCVGMPGTVYIGYCMQIPYTSCPAVGSVCSGLGNYYSGSSLAGTMVWCGRVVCQ